MTVVFIGQGLDQELIKKTLDDVLLNDKEWAAWEKVSITFCTVTLCLKTNQLIS